MVFLKSMSEDLLSWLMLAEPVLLFVLTKLGAFYETFSSNVLVSYWAIRMSVSVQIQRVQ